jgi:hypothetical protein
MLDDHGRFLLVDELASLVDEVFRVLSVLAEDGRR